MDAGRATARAHMGRCFGARGVRIGPMAWVERTGGHQGHPYVSYLWFAPVVGMEASTSLCEKVSGARKKSR
jgi:hypothetical protein